MGTWPIGTRSCFVNSFESFTEKIWILCPMQCRHFKRVWTKIFFFSENGVSEFLFLLQGVQNCRDNKTWYSFFIFIVWSGKLGPEQKSRQPLVCWKQFYTSLTFEILSFLVWKSRSGSYTLRNPGFHSLSTLCVDVACVYGAHAHIMRRVFVPSRYHLCDKLFIMKL